MVDLSRLEKPLNSIETFLVHLIGNPKEVDHSKILFLSDALESLVTKKRTQLPVMLTLTAHGLTRSKEMVKLLFDAGVGVSMESVRNLYDTWTYNDLLKENRVCPEEIAEGKPGTVIADNDNFKDDDLTGGTTSNRTNMMFIQPEKFIVEKLKGKTSLKRCSNGELKEMVAEEISISPYAHTERGEPATFDRIDTTAPTTESIRKKMMIHAIVRTNDDGSTISPEDQSIGAFTGFMSSISEPAERSKAYYYLTLPKSPSKKVLYTMMEKAVAAANLKQMPFIQFVGDQPVFALLEELKAENSEKFELIIPVLGSFHTQMAFMSAILQRFNGSGIKDILVNAGLIVDGSVDQALRGKHYNRAQRLYKLLYEALTRQLIKCGEDHGITLQNVNHLIEPIRDLKRSSNDRLLSMKMLLLDTDFSSYVTRLFSCVDGPTNHLAKFIISLMEMIEILFMNIDSIRTHNWEAYLESLRLMLPWMVAYNPLHVQESMRTAVFSATNG